MFFNNWIFLKIDYSLIELAYIFVAACEHSAIWRSALLTQQIRSVRRSLTHDALLTLIRTLVINKLDCGCS